MKVWLFCAISFSGLIIFGSVFIIISPDSSDRFFPKDFQPKKYLPAK